MDPNSKVFPQALKLWFIPPMQKLQNLTDSAVHRHCVALRRSAVLLFTMSRVLPVTMTKLYSRKKNLCSKRMFNDNG